MSEVNFLFRQDSASAWTSSNPTLAAGEIGVELDSANGVSPKFKIGNGILAWNDSSFNYFINDSDQSSLAAGGAGGGGASYDRGVWFGGGISRVNVIQYVDITSPGNATDFGDLSSVSQYGAASSDGTYGVVGLGAGSSGAPLNNIDYVTIATTGNASDFGDLLAAKQMLASSSDGTYAYFIGGDTGTPPTKTLTNVIEYITIATTGNSTDFGDVSAGSCYQSTACADTTYTVVNIGATSTDGISAVNTMHYFTNGTSGNTSDFGDLSVSRTTAAATEDATYGLFAGAWTGSARTNSIDYITIASPGNATDFGDLNYALNYLSATSNNTYAVTGGGLDAGTQINYMDYVTIATPGNATDFGDLTATTYGAAATSGSPS